jgi:hypothetical protein
MPPVEKSSDKQRDELYEFATAQATSSPPGSAKLRASTSPTAPTAGCRSIRSDGRARWQVVEDRVSGKRIGNSRNRNKTGRLGRWLMSLT